MPAVEEYGVEAVPPELRTAGWPVLFALNFTFYLSPISYVLGALAVTSGGLPLWGAVAAMVTGNAFAFACLVVIGQVGVDYGIPGQVGLRATLGYWGARLLSSPYRVVAATYWFAAQAVACAFGVQALWEGLTGDRLPLVWVAVVAGAAQAVLAVLGFDAMRIMLRVVLPLTLAFTAIFLVLYLTSDNPRYDAGRVLESPDQHFTWTGFATFVTVIAGAAFTFVTNVADWCRYSRSVRDVRIGLLASAAVGEAVPAFIGAYAAVATGEVNPFVAVIDLTGQKAILVVMLVAILVQALAANVTNVYTGGLSLVNAVPSLGRFRATLLVAAASVALAGFPDTVNRAQEWFVHLGNVAAPLTGVILIDYLVLKRQRLDVDALYEREGRYWYSRGFNLEAVAAIAAGVGVYYALDASWLKVAWGVGVGAGLYLLLARLRLAARADSTARAVT